MTLETLDAVHSLDVLFLCRQDFTNMALSVDFTSTLIVSVV